MKLVELVDEDHFLTGAGYECRHCHKKIRAGQSVLHQRIEGLSITFHVGCLRPLIEEAPPDVTREAVDELIASIRETGKAFP